jgi:hypothetical protein
VVPKAAIVAEHAASGTGAKQGPIIMNGQVLHSLSSERLALLKTMGGFVENEVGMIGSRVACQRPIRGIGRCFDARAARVGCCSTGRCNLL